MKNYALSVAIAIGCLSMSGQVCSPSAAFAKEADNRQRMSKENYFFEKERQNDLRRTASVIKRMPSQVISGPGADDKVIDQTPEGDMKVYVKDGGYYAYSWMSGMTSGLLDAYVSRVVTSLDGTKMYIQNPVTRFFDAEDNWIVGDINGDEVTFHFPQLISYSYYEYDDGEYEEYYDYALKLEFIEDSEEEGGWYYPSEDQDYTFKIQSDGTLKPVDTDMMIGQCIWIDGENGDDGYWSWQANGDVLLSMNVLEEEPIEIPSGVEIETWQLVSGISSTPVGIGVKDDTLYFSGSFGRMPDAVVEGKIVDDKVIFKGTQFLGVYWRNYSTAYFLTGHYEDAYDEDGTYRQFVIEDEMAFDYDEEKKILSCPEGAFLISSVPGRVKYYSYVDAPYICAPNPDAEIKSLLNPVLISFYDYEEADDYIYYPEILFNFPTVDADKQPIDTSKLFYQVIVDGEPYEFYDDEYELPQGQSMITDVPFGYDTDSMGFYAYGIEHDVILFTTGFSSIGIRTLYKNGENTIYSDVVWVDGYVNVRDSFASEEYASVKYYDMTGKLVQNPSNGIFIRQITRSNGTINTDKIIIR